MERWVFSVESYKLGFCILACHGFSDLDSAVFLPIYVAVAVLPVSKSVLRMLFLFSSLLHFSEDVGFLGSVLLHSASLLVSKIGGQTVGFELVMFYSIFVHVPMHVLRLVEKRRAFGLFAFALFAALFSLLSSRVPNRFELTHRMQRIVISHILVEMVHATREATPPRA